MKTKENVTVIHHSQSFLQLTTTAFRNNLTSEAAAKKNRKKKVQLVGVFWRRFWQNRCAFIAPNWSGPTAVPSRTWRPDRRASRRPPSGRRSRFRRRKSARTGS